MADVNAVLQALEALNNPSNKVAFDQANTWLQDFQHSNEAWATCNTLLLSQEAPLLARIFAAQTFRAKVTYDLGQLNTSFLPSLRSTILTALEQFSGGPKTIIVQLCLALAGLALQFPAWQDVAVREVIDRFGQNPSTVPTLLEFLRVLPEEVNGNTKIPVSNDEYREGARRLLSANATQVLALLSMYITAPGITPTIQSQILEVLRSWLIAGEVLATDVTATPLFSLSFDGLDSDELFDTAVDVICDLIHETQEIDDNMPAIELIVPKLVEIKPKITLVKDDSDKVRGFARIFSEAGECYRILILEHPETFFPIVEAVGQCSAYPDLDVVPITFQFWMRLAQSIGKRQSVSPLFIEAYKSLMTVMMQHLHFPEDSNTMNAQEADNFRSFRHVIGDTLKDCCYVLGAEHCVNTVYEYLTAALARRDAAGHSAVSWQEIEAPLFSLRAMGAEVDPNDDQVIPKIMDLLPSLPEHPRVQYAAILVISRYSEWTARHPSYIPFQLRFISSGFESPDSEVPAAASQAMTYLCMDCKQHMIPYLDQLHAFLTSVGSKILQEDRRKIYEAVAHVISAMPMEQAAQSLQVFSMEILKKIHSVTTQVTASPQVLQEVNDGLENLESMLAIIGTFGDELPAACANTCQETWTVFDAFIQIYYPFPETTERVTRVLRCGLRFFGAAAKPVVPSVIERMSVSFEEAGYSSLLWIAGKAVALCGEDRDPALRSAIKAAYSRSTSKVVELLQREGIRKIPDVIEDYLRFLLTLLDVTPEILFDATTFPTAFRIAVGSLTLIHSDIVFAALDVVRGVVAADYLDPSISSKLPEAPLYAATIRQVIEAEGSQLTSNLLAGLVGDFPEDAASLVITIFRMLALLWPQQLLAWLPQVLDQLPVAQSFGPAKTQLLSDISAAINSRQVDKVKQAIITFHRFSIKARDRRRVAPIEA